LNVSFREHGAQDFPQRQGPMIPDGPPESLMLGRKCVLLAL
jgi:hypothetical protein